MFCKDALNAMNNVFLGNNCTMTLRGFFNGALNYNASSGNAQGTGKEKIKVTLLTSKSVWSYFFPFPPYNMTF